MGKSTSKLNKVYALALLWIGFGMRIAHSSSWIAGGRPNTELNILSINTSTLQMTHMVISTAASAWEAHLPERPLQKLLVEIRYSIIHLLTVRPEVLGIPNADSDVPPGYMRGGRAVYERRC